jgi:hypothetical protein
VSICILAVAIGASAVAGIILGSAVATFTGGFVGRLLFQVPAIDWATLSGMAVLFSLVSAIAVYVPAWRAARSIQPLLFGASDRGSALGSASACHSTGRVVQWP